MGLKRTFRDYFVLNSRLAKEGPFLPWDKTPRKSYLRRLIELIYLRWDNEEPAWLYNVMGMDKAGRHPSDYMVGHRDFFRYVCGPNHGYAPLDWAAALHEKRVFDAYATACGIPHVPILAAVGKTFGVLMAGRSVAIEELEAKLRTLSAFFLKPTDSYGGQGVRRVEVRADGSFWTRGQPFDLREEASGDQDWLIQECIRQHPQMAKLNASSVNTVRIVTCRNRERTEFSLFAQPFVRVGRKGSQVDNISSGGFCVGVKPDGTLTRFGLLEPMEKYDILLEHPDQQLPFEGFPIPFYQEAVQLVLDAHRHFSRVWLIGWDVAITESGPVLIEGNANIDLSEFQTFAQKPLKPRLREIGLIEE